MAVPAILGAAARLLGKQALKGAVKNKIKGAAKDKVTKGLKGKAKKITKEKLLGKKKERGGPLALRGGGTSSIVSFRTPRILERRTRINLDPSNLREGGGSTDSKTYAAILKEIKKLNRTFAALKKSISSKNAADKKAIADRRKQLNLERKRERENKLESKKLAKESRSEESGGGPQLGIFELIKRFFSNILIGGLLTLLLKNQKKVFKGIDLAIKNWRHITRFLVGFKKPFLRLLKFSAKVLLNPLYLPGKILKGTIKLTGKAIKGTFSALGKGFKIAIDGIFKLGKKLIDAARAGVDLARKGINFGGRAFRAFSGALRGGQGIRGATQAVGTAAQRSARQAQQAKEARQAAEAAKKARDAKKASQAASTATQATRATTQVTRATTQATTQAATSAAAKTARRAIKIPVIGPLLVAIDSWLSGDPPNQTLFKAGGAAIGGLLGNFIPIPVLGMMLGEYIGEYVGNLFYHGLKTSGGWKKAGEILWNDLKRAFDVGKTVMDWLQKGVGRYINNWPKLRIPNPKIPGPIQRVLEAATLWRAGKFEGMHDFLGKFPLSPFKFISDKELFGNKKGKFSHIPDPTFMVSQPIEFLKHVKNSFLGTLDKKPNVPEPKMGDMSLPGDGSETQDMLTTDDDRSLGQTMDAADSSNKPTSGSSDPYSIKLAKLLANYEGIRENAYPDAIHGWKVPTIGIGATYYPKGFRLKGKVKKGDKITKEEAYWIKAQHIIDHRNRIFREIGQSEYNKLPDNVKAALESKAFNYGSLGSTLSGLVKEANKTKNYSKISSYFRNTLAKHNRGRNSWRRNDEAGLIDSGKSKRVGLAFGKGTSSTSTPGSPSPPAAPVTSAQSESSKIEEAVDKTENNREQPTPPISPSTSTPPSSPGPAGQISQAPSRMDAANAAEALSKRGPSGAVVPVPIPMGGGQQQVSGGGRSRGMLGTAPASSLDVLNSYYRLQLLGFLYKQG